MTKVGNAFNKLLTRNEHIGDNDEFVRVLQGFILDIGCTGFCYICTGALFADVVFNNSTARHDRTKQSDLLPLGFGTAIGERYSELETKRYLVNIQRLFEDFTIDGPSCCVKVASAKNRSAKLILLGLADKSAFDALMEEQLLPLFGLEADRRLRQHSAFTSIDRSALSDQERRCLVWASKGKSMEEIGEIVGVKRRTVEFHIKNARHKLDAGNVTHAVFKAVRAGIL
ncbi:helix-turn-helix transcriptional regulator [Pseudaestuariivita rosea]|uniref:helix-turn-helix transcriptional regulator n=1 Tax=Pseudaestuariivita rosea TaxID=2763263 RepID=UPI001ABBB386|nr:helix-turn-helix transcriptional regulator [Pseudaestuariivita rosea]